MLTQGKDLNEKTLRQTLEEGLKEYSKSHAQKIYENPLQQLKAAEDELKKYSAQESEIR